jgi:hypothetical protein
LDARQFLNVRPTSFVLRARFGQEIVDSGAVREDSR